MSTFQVTKHIFDSATGKTTHTKFGKPVTRLIARRTADRLNEAEIKAEGDPEGPVPPHIVSYSIAPVSVGVQHRA